MESNPSDPKLKVYRKHYELLLRNISVTDELLGRLRDANLISDTMIHDIQEESSGVKAKSARLLSFTAFKIPMGSNFELFCDALEFCGHQILAVFLRGEMEELLRKSQSDSQVNLKKAFVSPRKSLDGSDKVSDVAIGAAYARAIAVIQEMPGTLRPEEADLIANVRRLKQQVSQKEEEIRSLEEALNTEKDLVGSLRQENCDLKVEFKLTRDKLAKLMDTQGRADHARDKQIRQLDQRVNVFDAQVRHYTHLIIEALGKELEEEESTGDLDSELLNRLGHNLNRLLGYLDEIRKRTLENQIAWDNERKNICDLLGQKYHGMPPLRLLEEHFQRIEGERDGWERKLHLLLSYLTSDEGETVKALPSNEKWDVVFSILGEVQKTSEDLKNQIAELKRQLATLQRNQQARPQFNKPSRTPRPSDDDSAVVKVPVQREKGDPVPVKTFDMKSVDKTINNEKSGIRQSPVY